MLYLYIFLILISETIALSFFKRFSMESNYLYFAIGMFFYLFVSIFLVKSFKYEGMGIVNVLWSAFSVIFVVSAGILFFRETFTHVEMFAMVMIMCGVVVLRLHTA
ncbi:MAG: SMR family transporter [Candidatus Gracilibacteria bacterium]